MPRLWVIGSLVLDNVYRVDELPRPGQSVFATESAQFLGGKGANQAVAAARWGRMHGLEVAFCGCVGEDSAGLLFVESLGKEGIETAHLKVKAGVRTGSAAIFVGEGGLNMIAVDVGANHALTAEDIAQVPVEADDWVLLQLEVTDEALAAASQRGRVVLNPAPAKPVDPEILSRLHAITPNETECQALFGIAPVDELAWPRATQLMHGHGVDLALITLGAQGVFCSEKGGRVQAHHAAPTVQAVDTTAAGDVFNGVFTASLALGETPNVAVRNGVWAASLSVTRPGAIASIPTREEATAFRAGRP